MLYRIIYVSAARELFSDEEIVNLLGVSRRNNREADITGLMIYHEGNFFQVLEGPEEEVSALYDRICSDSRHRQQILLWQGSVGERAFPDWRMGFSRFEQVAAAERDGMQPLEDVVAAREENVSDAVVKLLMDSFLSSFRDVDPGDKGQARRATRNTEPR